ncbi:MAG: endonuclease Q family protein [Candidatus Nanoarchaeia archaeon]|nr:endonuclease Q family protein [Candidatus Nanoarchaeia archaeon]
MIYGDFHIHSKYSRATSKSMDIKNLSIYGAMKGLNLIGTGDITHPKWINEVKSETIDLKNGFYKSKYNDMHFLLSSEISCIYSQDNEVKRIHHLLFFPSFEIAAQFNDALAKYLSAKGKKCNLLSDGRPIVGLTSVELCDIAFKISTKIMVIPAHIWTPWFSLFGSMSGFDKIEECYKEYSDKIYAYETGLSSDPTMNWRISNLKNRLLISNSDCHGPFVDRIGREANALKGSILDFSYDKLFERIKKRELEFTIEVDPSYGKYHFDGHRKCNVCLSPKDSIKNNDLCLFCKKKLTIGVLHRVEELADCPPNNRHENSADFHYHVPLIEIISKLYGKGINTKIVHSIYEDLIKKHGNEYSIMFDLSIEAIDASLKGLGPVIKSLRDKTMKVLPGYDGVYGEPIIQKIEPKLQKSVIDF